VISAVDSHRVRWEFRWGGLWRPHML